MIVLPLNKSMNPCPFSVFAGRNATGTRCEGGTFAVLSPVCIVRDPVDKLRIQSRKHGGSLGLGFRQVPEKHSSNGVLFVLHNNQRSALVQSCNECLD